MFCCPSKKKVAGPVEASIANGALVVSYTGGDAPRIWRANLAVARTATVELQEATPNAFRVVMRSAGMPDEEIVVLKDKESALGAFRAITEALMSDVPQTVVAAAPRRTIIGTLLRMVAWCFFLFIVAIAILSVLLKLFGLPSLSTQLQDRVGQEMRKIQMEQQKAMQDMGVVPGMGGLPGGPKMLAPAAPAAPQPRAGVPVPADELFGE